MKENEQSEISFTEEENKLLKKYLEEYNDLYQKILNLSELEFIENIRKRIEIIVKSKLKNYSQESITNIEKYLKENIYIPDFKFASLIKKNVLNRTKRELALHYFRGEIIPHCSEDKKDDYYIHACGQRFQFFRYKSNNNALNANNFNLNYHHGIHYDYILYCIKCNMIYKSSLIKFKCNNNDTEFYSKLLISNEDSSKSNNNINNKCYATWKKYHCNAIINDTMKCDKCEQSYIFFQESNTLYCPKCKTRKNPLDITWKCLICQKQFQTEAKIYNPLEYKSLKICVKDAIVNKIKAKPEYMVCKCQIDIKNTVFFHKSVCKGELYLGEINSQKVVVCGKCDTLGLFEGYIWTCPKCMKRFKTKKREGSVCTKLGLVESDYETKININNSNKKNRNLSEQNSKKFYEAENNLSEINHYMSDKNSNTITSDNEILKYLNDIKDSLNLNNINLVKDNKEPINSTINQNKIENLTYKRIYANSFVQNKNNNGPSTDSKINNLSFSENCLSNLEKMNNLSHLSNCSFNSKYGNNPLTGSSHKEINLREKEENSNDSKIKKGKYIINNYKKKTNFHIKSKYQLKTENKEKENELNSTFKKKNIPFSLMKTNKKMEKTKSETKDKKIKMKSEEFFSLQIDENNWINSRKKSSYKKPYYSINNSFIKGLQKENTNLNENRKSEILIKSLKNDIFNNKIENKDNLKIGYAGEDISIQDNNNIKEKFKLAIEDNKKKYKKKKEIKNIYI